MKIVIETSGGVINTIYSDLEGVEVVVIDHDDLNPHTVIEIVNQATQDTPHLLNF